MPKFSKKSIERKNTCVPELQNILDEIIKYYDFTVIQGHRDKETQNEAYAMGNSKLSWPNSKHNSYPSEAVDIAPWPIPAGWGDKWKDRVKFYELAALVKYEAAKQGVNIRWGGDWDSDHDYWDNSFDDLVHFERV